MCSRWEVGFFGYAKHSHLILMIQGPLVGSLTGLTGSVTDWKLPVSHAVKFDDDSVTAKKHGCSLVQTVYDEWWRGTRRCEHAMQVYTASVGRLEWLVCIGWIG